jgi:hypothetical protein
MNNVAGMFVAQGKDVDAEDLYVKCLELRAEILGFNNVVSINLI